MRGDSGRGSIGQASRREGGGGGDQRAEERDKKRGAHISFQILVPRVRFDTDEIAEHAGHSVVTEDDDLLSEELETARVARQVEFWDLRPQAARERREQGLPGKDGVDCQVQGTGYKDEMRAPRYESIGGD